MIIILMGVTGSGKTTVGGLLARKLRWKFYEGDDFHSPANIEKMTRGMPLSDQDRRPWLKALRDIVRSMIERGENGVIACSALKKSYRRMLKVSDEVIFVYLKASIPLIQKRLKQRTHHFMNPTLIESQFATLEQPRDALRVDADSTPAQVVQCIRERLSI